VDGADDFKKATEFIKYASEEGKGQVNSVRIGKVFQLFLKSSEKYFNKSL
jgi:phosphoribosylformylglycinamidine (FGAM) synthase PurS component